MPLQGDLGDPLVQTPPREMRGQAGGRAGAMSPLVSSVLIITFLVKEEASTC